MRQGDNLNRKLTGTTKLPGASIVAIVTSLFGLAGLAALIISVAGCSGGSSIASKPSTSSEALWVPNFYASNLVEYLARQLDLSGDTAPQITNASAPVVNPEATLFDKKGNLWVTNCSDPINDAGTIIEFSRGQLSSLGSNPEPNQALTDDGTFNLLDCPYGAQFDTSGNLWVVNRFFPNLVEFTPSQLKAGGPQIPNTNIQSDDFQDPEGIAFDTNGTLWITDVFFSEVDGFKAATLAAASGTETVLVPDILNSSSALNGATAVAFDPAQNQWVANCFSNTVVKFLATDITATGSPTPAVTIGSTTVTTPGGSADSVSCPEGLAFDKRGHLWVSNLQSDTFGSLAEFTTDQLASSGSPAPAVFIDADSTGSNLNEPVLLSFGPSVP